MASGGVVGFCLVFRKLAWSVGLYCWSGLWWSRRHFQRFELRYANKKRRGSLGYAGQAWAGCRGGLSSGSGDWPGLWYVGCLPNVIYDFIFFNKNNFILYLFLYFVYMCSHMLWYIHLGVRRQLFFIMWVPDMALSS